MRGSIRRGLDIAGFVGFVRVAGCEEEEEKENDDDLSLSRIWIKRDLGLDII